LVNEAEVIVKNEMQRLREAFKLERVEPTISSIYCLAEDIRCRELKKAFLMMEGLNEVQKRTVEKLSKVLVTQLLHNPIKTIRLAAMRDDALTVKVAKNMFDVQVEGE
jgi:glutamyl-tRNA reductase